MTPSRKYEAVGKFPCGSGFFASDSEEDALEWFRGSMKDAVGASPSADEEKYFADGHDVIRTTLKGEFTWRLEKS